MTTKDLLRIIGFLLFVLIALVLFAFYKKPEPPIIRFIDEKTNLSLTGVVYLDEKYIGEVKGDGFFENLPKEYCKGKHILTLKSSDYILKWGSLPSDCNFDLVTLNYEEGRND